MTAFTDEDLKRLKFHVTGNRRDVFADGIYCRELEALLARLEAAENAYQYAKGFIVHGDSKLKIFDIAWLRAAGKGH